MNQAERRLYLIHTLLSERPSCRRQEIPKDAARQRVLLRGLMNVRPAKQISPEFLSVQDEYLRQELSEAGVTHVEDLQPVSGELYLWQGDITKLSCGAIVNAANSGWTAPKSWRNRATRNRPDRRSSRVRTICRAASFCTRWDRS